MRAAGRVTFPHPGSRERLSVVYMALVAGAALAVVAQTATSRMVNVVAAACALA